RRDELLRHARDLRPLATVDRLERRAGDRSASAPYLDENHHRAVERHEVDFPGAAAIVASHDRVLEGAEEFLRHRLTPPPERAPPIHGARIYSPVLALARRSGAVNARTCRHVRHAPEDTCGGENVRMNPRHVLC